MNNRPFPTEKYNLIYADPGWKYRDKASAGKRGAEHKFRVMDYKAISRLPVDQIAADDCLLAMWWVPPQPVEALYVVDAWGFKLKTMQGFTWAKRTKRGLWHFGMGNLSRANAECCLFATKGRPQRVSASVRSLIEAPVREHSRKPDEARDRLVELMGDVPRIELFAREVTPGWASWGDEAAKAA